MYIGIGRRNAKHELMMMGTWFCFCRILINMMKVRMSGNGLKLLLLVFVQVVIFFFLKKKKISILKKWWWDCFHRERSYVEVLRSMQIWLQVFFFFFECTRPVIFHRWFFIWKALKKWRLFLLFKKKQYAVCFRIIAHLQSNCYAASALIFLNIWPKRRHSNLMLQWVLKTNGATLERQRVRWFFFILYLINFFFGSIN